MNSTVDFIFGVDHAPQAVTIQTTVQNPPSVWSWHLTMRHFEAVHGMSRVVRLVPDKLATAAAINKEGLVEDGSFLIQLVINLMDVYCTQADRLKDAADLNGNHTERLFSFGFEDHVEADGEEVDGEPQSFEQVLDDMRTEMVVMKQTLERRDMQLFRTQALAILRKCDIIRIMSTIFLDFVHPVWIRQNRARLAEMEDVEPTRVWVRDRLTRSGPHHLENEFLQLAAQDHLFD